MNQFERAFVLARVKILIGENGTIAGQRWHQPVGGRVFPGDEVSNTGGCTRDEANECLQAERLRVRVSVQTVQKQGTQSMLRNLLNNEAGFVISAELALVLTIAVIGMVVGLSHVAMAVNQELTDVATAIGSLNQSYSFTGFKCCPCNSGAFSASTPGSRFLDQTDTCDAGCCIDVATCTADPEDRKW